MVKCFPLNYFRPLVKLQIIVVLRLMSGTLKWKVLATLTHNLKR